MEEQPSSLVTPTGHSGSHDPVTGLETKPPLAPTVAMSEATATVEAASPPQEYIFSECERVSFSEELAADLVVNPSRLADAIPDEDNQQSLVWGVNEALRTLAEALELAQTQAWREWSPEARAFRWHHAGRAELNL